MESRTTALKVSFEDLSISFESENSSNKLLDKRKENRKPKSRKYKNIPSCLPKKDLVKKSSLETPQLVVNDACENDNSGRSKNSGLQKLGITVQKDKAKSFVSRLRANTWSPKQSRRTPEFDNIGLLHKKELEETTLEAEGVFHERTWTYPCVLGPTELLYLHIPGEECLSSEEMDKMPRIEDKNPGTRDQSYSQSDTNENMENPRPKDTHPLCEDINFRFKGFMSGIDDKVPTFYESTLKNPRQNTSNTFEDRKPRYVDANSRFEDKSPRYDDRSPTFEDTNRRLDVIPGLQHPDFADSTFVDTRRNSNVSLKNGTISTARLFLPPQNDCEKKSCCTLSPNCTRKLRASSFGSLPRVPSGKLNLVQSGVWQRLRDEDNSKSRSRSFTH